MKVKLCSQLGSELAASLVHCIQGTVQSVGQLCSEAFRDSADQI